MAEMTEKTAPAAGNASVVTRKDLVRLFWRSFHLQGTTNWERMLGLSYAYAIIPLLRKIYPDKERLSKALKRHLELFNSNPTVVTFIMGINIAMEEEAARNPEFDESSISAVKVALMGPLAGIGDSLFWGTFRVIAAGIGIAYAMEGSILGPILFLLIYNLPATWARWKLTFIGYQQGNKFLESAFASGSLNRLTYVAKVLGLLVVGSMVASLVKLSTPLVFSFGGAEVALQKILDSILPQMLPLAASFFAYWLLKKGNKLWVVLMGFFLGGTLLALLGIF